jgi:hypothetical protein
MLWRRLTRGGMSCSSPRRLTAWPGLCWPAWLAPTGLTSPPVDGDQPSLLIDLVTWGETLGFDILAAGKSSEYDFVFDRTSGRVTSNGVTAQPAGAGRLVAH